jgi:two-component system NarL family response regulator
VITTYGTDEDVYRTMQAGAKTYLLKDTSDEEVLNMIRAVYTGEHSCPTTLPDC